MRREKEIWALDMHSIQNWPITRAARLPKTLQKVLPRSHVRDLPLCAVVPLLNQSLCAFFQRPLPDYTGHPSLRNSTQRKNVPVLLFEAQLALRGVL